MILTNQLLDQRSEKIDCALNGNIISRLVPKFIEKIIDYP